MLYALNVQCDSETDADPHTGFCRGTEDSDNIRGNGYDEVIEALAGNDFVEAFDGNDTVYGGEDSDQVDAFPGNDIVDGGPGDDGHDDSLEEGEQWWEGLNLEGAEDSDTVYGQGGEDLIDAVANDTFGSFDRSLGGGHIQCANIFYYLSYHRPHLFDLLLTS